MKALICGGAACVWDDLRAYGPHSGIVLAVNDILAVYPHRVDHFASLHCEKLSRWSAEREKRGGNMDFVTWTRPEKGGADRLLSGWSGGSSGMFAVGVALDLGCTSVVLCGVPMTADPHFFGGAPWDACMIHREAWERRLPDMQGKVFSMSGWTQELLGAPPGLMAA